MEIYVIHTTHDGGASIPSVQLDKATNAEVFDRQTEYLTPAGCTADRETFEYKPTVKIDLGDGEPPVEIPNPRPQVITRATIRNAEGYTVATVETYLYTTPA